MSCPICHKPAVQGFRPFCSKTCKERDLLNWLGDGYVIPGEPLYPSNDLPGMDDDESPAVFIPPKQDED